MTTLVTGARTLDELAWLQAAGGLDARELA
jgi:hypothetical protein